MTTKTAISEEEKKRKREILDNINASNRLENIPPAEVGSYEWELNENWVNGEITLAEKKQLIFKHYDI